MHKIEQVLIVGGTHGNELTGVYLVKKLERSSISRPSISKSKYGFEVHTLLGNPEAFAKGVRYIDQDLNRSFDRQSLQEPALSNHESKRAWEIAQTFERNFDASTTIIIDIHSSTANMGSTLILDNQDSFSLQLAAYLSMKIPSLKVYSSAHSGRSQDALRSLSRFGFGIEIGPAPQGVLDARRFQQAEQLLYEILNYLQQYNQQNIKLFMDEVKVYQYTQTVDYPRDQLGELQGMIHPQLQFRDYQALHPGEPMFLTFDQEAIAYVGSSIAYPVFINEAAYYEKGIAMYLTHEIQHSNLKLNAEIV